jgi:hypothetical protein
VVLCHQLEHYRKQQYAKLRLLQDDSGNGGSARHQAATAVPFEHGCLYSFEQDLVLDFLLRKPQQGPSFDHLLGGVARRQHHHLADDELLHKPKQMRVGQGPYLVE